MGWNRYGYVFHDHINCNYLEIIVPKFLKGHYFLGFDIGFYTSCVVHAQAETSSCRANGSNPATAVWAVLTNHQTKINNDQNDLSSIPKMT